MYIYISLSTHTHIYTYRADPYFTQTRTDFCVTMIRRKSARDGRLCMDAAPFLVC